MRGSYVDEPSSRGADLHRVPYGGAGRYANTDDTDLPYPPEEDNIPEPTRRPKGNRQNSKEELGDASVSIDDESAIELIKKPKKSHRNDRSGKDLENPDVSGSHSMSSDGTIEELPTGARKKKKKAKKEEALTRDEGSALIEMHEIDPRASQRPTSQAGAGGKTALQTQPSPGEARRALRVHVKTQPGATVRIHQGVPPPTAPKPKPAFGALNQSGTSSETDI